jgi:hypothetical protein
LDWDTVQKKLPWNVVILLGSGFAIADAAVVSSGPLVIQTPNGSPFKKNYFTYPVCMCVGGVWMLRILLCFYHGNISGLYRAVNFSLPIVSLLDVMQESGLSDWIGRRLEFFDHLPRELIALFVSIMVASLTEIVSNVATITLFLPILRALVSGRRGEGAW